MEANTHLERIRQQAQAAKQQKRKNMRTSWLALVCVFLFFALFTWYNKQGSSPDAAPTAQEDTIRENPDAAPGTGAASSDEPAPEAAQGPDTQSWELMLVNAWQALPEDFTVDLLDTCNTTVDYRVAEPLENLIAAAQAEGISLRVCSGYRNVAQQQTLFDNKCRQYRAQGYSREDSEILASRYVQRGGMSEHHTGLAVDLLTGSLTSLDESFAETKAYTWLQENAAAYGFIERYPQDKSQETGIAWEPWHYRYVGQANAQAITSGGLCLEEYLQQESRQG